MPREEHPIPHVVVVDDDEVVTSTLKLYLESAGFAVSTARDGVRALELASGADVALVILDLMIPGLSGREVCRRVDCAPGRPTTRRILSAAAAGDGAARRDTLRRWCPRVHR